MLDTIVLTIDGREIAIQSAGRFTPSAQTILAASVENLGARKFIKCHYNPSKREVQKYGYLPRLTLMRSFRGGAYVVSLRIEFSAPKLLFGNNFDELTESDFDRVIDTLYHKLLEMDVLIRREVLRQATVSAIHYSKNILLPKFTTSSLVLHELDKINLNQRLDLSKTDFRNGGHAVRYHANSYEVTFYDKIKDLEKANLSEKRAIEKDSTLQLNLFSEIPQKPEVLRMEVRLGDRRKLKSLLQKLGFELELDFQSLFKQSIAQKILLHYWEQIANELRLLIIHRLDPEELYRAIEQSGSVQRKPTKILQMVGLLQIVDSIGMRGLRALLHQSSGRTYQRFKREIKELTLPQERSFFFVSQLKNELERFKSLSLKNAILKECGEPCRP